MVCLPGSAFLLSTLLALYVLAAVGAPRFGRNEARCIAICNSRESEECRMCNTRIPMRFGKRRGAAKGGSTHRRLYTNQDRPTDIKLVALIPGSGESQEDDESDDVMYDDEK